MKDFNEFYSPDGVNPGIEAPPLNFEDEFSEMMWDFIASLDDELLESLTDEQVVLYGDIIEAASEGPDEPELSDMPVETASESEEVSEKLPRKKVKRDLQAKRKRSREHRKVKSKRKIEGRRKRKTAAFKRGQKVKKRMARRGLTKKGKRRRTYINKG